MQYGLRNKQKLIKIIAKASPGVFFVGFLHIHTLHVTTFLKIKNVEKIKNVKKRKKRDLNKKRKKRLWSQVRDYECTASCLRVRLKMSQHLKCD